MGQACGPACCTNDEVSPKRDPSKKNRRINGAAGGVDEDFLQPEPARRENKKFNLRKALITIEQDDEEDDDGSPPRDGSNLSDKDGSQKKKKVIQVTQIDTESDYLETYENTGDSSGQHFSDLKVMLDDESGTLEEVKVQEFNVDLNGKF